MAAPSNTSHHTLLSELAACTLHGSTVVVRNTFIDIENDQEECINHHPNHMRARSLPPIWDDAHERNSGRKRAETYVELRQRILSMDSDKSDQSQTDAVEANVSHSVRASVQDGTIIASESSPLGQSVAVRTSSVISEASSYSGTTASWAVLHHRAEQDDTLASSCGGSTVDSTEVPFDSPQLRYAPDASFHDEMMLPGEFTTVILRGIPHEYTRDMLLDTLNSNGFFGHFDFLYLPKNFGTNATFGYGFINFATGAYAARFMSEFQEFSNWSVPSSSKALVEWSDGRQGLDEQIERYRNSGMMHPSVSDDARPILLCKGLRVPFPAPTQTLKPLRVRAWKKNASLCLQSACSDEKSSQNILRVPNEVTSSPTRRGEQLVDSGHTSTPVRRLRRRR